MRIGVFGLAAVAALTCGTAQPAKAAFILFDDTSAAETTTVSLNDFERGFSIDGVLVQSGRNNPVTVTEPESFSYSGTWIDRGQSIPGSFAQLAFDGTVLSDENVYTVSTDGTFGTIAGRFCSDPDVCAIPIGSIVSVVPETAHFDQAFLTASFVSDPEPASGVVLIAGFAGLLWARRNSRKSV